jgi:hypothetical protein
MFTWGPILLLALLPPRRGVANTLVLPMFERRWLVITALVFMVFASMNQYSRLQFNSGFRYLVPLVPFMMLAIADNWRRFPGPMRWAVAVVALVHSWVLVVFREPVARSWAMFLDEGVQLPWYRVLTLTANPDHPWIGAWWIPAVLLGTTLLFALIVWKAGARMENTNGFP